MPHIPRSPGQSRRPVRRGLGPRMHSGGFTLVEMLVAVALVLLLMSLFAQVFDIAGSTITRQRGLAENDQRSRSLQNQLKADLDKRTFRLMMPWMRYVSGSVISENGSLAESAAVQRQGYFYISENDPDDDTDDLLQFTIHVGIETKNKDLTTIYGKAEVIPNAGNILQYPNQPEADDGWPVANGASESSAAEISYFLRGNRLYRRVLLLREPLPLSTSVTQPGYQDNSVSPPVFLDFFDPAVNAYSAGNQRFWDDFDFSAFYFGNLSATPPVQFHAYFHGVGDLDNASAQTQFPLGKPQWRFGHSADQSSAAASTFFGCSREFDATSGTPLYFGRFTHEETSNRYFHYPQTLADYDQNGTPDHNPMFDDPSSTGDDITLDTSDYVFPNFRNGPRRGEDLVLSNVHAFDVKVWDPIANGGAGAFVDIGGSDVTRQIPANAFATSRRLNATYGPKAGVNNAQNRVFDTWHPRIDLNNDGTNDPPPFHHLRFTPVGSGLTGLYGSNIPVWQPNYSYTEGEVVFPTQNAPPNDHQRANGFRFFYRCVRPGTTGAASTEPSRQQWPAVAGAQFTEPGMNRPTWEAVDNWMPLQAIQITIRFLDVTSNQMRQMTLVHSLVD